MDFIEKLAGDIDKGIKAISSKGKEIVDSAKLKGELREVQSAIQSRYAELGKCVYEMNNIGHLNEESIKLNCADIKGLYNKITEIEESIRKIELDAASIRFGKDAIICTNCKSLNKSGDKFCCSCGTGLSAEVALVAGLCPACSTPLKEDAKFCGRCGSKI